MRNLVEENIAGAPLVNWARFGILESRMALSEEIAWPCPPPDWPSAWQAGEQEDVHVWAISLGASAEILETLESHLSASERERAGRFHFALHRDRFIAGRGWLRVLLARYGGSEPSDVEFTYGPQGKPALRLGPGEGGFEFNLAHSDDLALVAVTRGAAVGIDIEHLRPLKEAEDLVARFFSPRESEAFSRLSSDQKHLAFFNLWTRKEAWLKATGEGIAQSLRLVEVSFLPGERAQLWAVPGDSVVRWSLHDLAPAPGFAAALAIKTAPSSLRCWRLGEMKV